VQRKGKKLKSWHISDKNAYSAFIARAGLVVATLSDWKLTVSIAIRIKVRLSNRKYLICCMQKSKIAII